MSQVFRPIQDGNKTAGTWVVTSGDNVIYTNIDDLICDNTTTVATSPNSTGTWQSRVKMGIASGVAARPFINSTSMWDVVLRSPNLGTVVYTLRLYEGGSTTLGAGTLRDTWSLGTISSGTFQRYRRNLAGSVIDAITDFSDLWIEVDAVCNAAGERWQLSQMELILGDAMGNRRGRIVQSFAGLSALPATWRQEGGSTILGVPTVGSNRLDTVTSGNILVCHDQDLPADVYAKATIASGYDGSSVGVGAFVRLNRTWVTSGTDNYRYNEVNDSTEAEHQIKLDGISASVKIDFVAFATEANLDDGDVTETRAVGTTISGRKNGTELNSGTDTTQQAAGHQGIVFRQVGATLNGVTDFETGSIPNVHPALLPSNQHRHAA